MTHLDESGPPDPSLTGSRHRARHEEAAPAPYPPEDPDDRPGRPPPRTHRAAGGRAGRNLPAAIAVGVVLGGTVVASLFWWRPAFLAVLVAAVLIGTWEMSRAVRQGGVHPPLVPMLLGGAAITCLAFFAGVETLPLSLFATLIAVLVWRLADGAPGYQRDVTYGALIVMYVPFLASFAALLARPEDGDFRILVTLAAVVLSDTGGYVSGVFLGRHPMAPSVSPKKSWEGLVGSLVWAGAGSAVLLYYTLDTAWWQGALFGLAISGAAVLGDLAESLLKRDLNIKDMSNLLPGHGGLMDRLDSILLAVPTSYAMLALIAPAS